MSSASPSAPPARDPFIDELAEANLFRMSWLLIVSTTLSIGFALFNFIQIRQWKIVPWQAFDIGGSAVFLLLFWLGLRRRLPPRTRWALSPAYFAFWLALMMGYYFTALPVYGENMTFALGAVTPSVLILLPPRWFLSLLGGYYLAFCVLQFDLTATHPGRSVEDIFSSMANGTLAVVVATLGAWFLYSARRTNFLKEQLLAGRAAALRRTESHLRAILENIPFQAWLKDVDGRFLAVNREFADASGRRQEEIIGRTATDIYSAGRAGQYEQEDRDIVRNGERLQAEQTVLLGGSTAWYEVFKSPVLDEHGRCVGTAGLARDITDRKELEHRLLEASRAKSEFLATMSHEIRTPMNSVLGYAQLLRELPLDATEREYVDSILGSGQILLSVINDILDFSRIDAGQLTLSPINFPFVPLLERCLRMFEPQTAGKSLQLRLDAAPDLPAQIHGDPFRIEQILINLLSNAVKFTDHGSVTLRVRARDGLLLLEVIDTGIGIAPDQLARLFQPFSQADASISRRYSGTGLGLVITQRLCDLMGGRIDVQSRPGEGSIFTASLPFVASPAAATDPEEDGGTSAAPVDDLSALRVLVVEDNALNRRLLTAILRRWHVEPALAASGIEALQIIEARAFDIVLMDVQMPGMDGFDATRQIRAWERDHPMRQKARIIALTALAMPGDIERCLEAGMDAYLTKPIHTPSLQRALGAALK